MTGDRGIAMEARGLAKSFAGKAVLREVSCHLAPGEIVALTGVNGAGKTTLLRLLAGLSRPDRGNISWFGRCVGDCETRRLIGLLGHESGLYPKLTVGENLLFAARMHGLRKPAQQVDAWLRKCGLAAERQRLPGVLPRGIRQRVAIARAAIHRPSILLLDEPLAGLDESGVEHVRVLLQEWRQAVVAVLFTTHDCRATERLADRVLHLQAGRLIELGTEREPDSLPQKHAA